MENAVSFKVRHKAAAAATKGASKLASKLSVEAVKRVQTDERVIFGKGTEKGCTVGVLGPPDRSVCPC